MSQIPHPAERLGRLLGQLRGVGHDQTGGEGVVEEGLLDCVVGDDAHGERDRQAHGPVPRVARGPVTVEDEPCEEARHDEEELHTKAVRSPGEDPEGDVTALILNDPEGKRWIHVGERRVEEDPEQHGRRAQAVEGVEAFAPTRLHRLGGRRAHRLRAEVRGLAAVRLRARGAAATRPWIIWRSAGADEPGFEAPGTAASSW